MKWILVLIAVLGCGGGVETDTVVQCLTTCPDGSEPKMEYQCSMRGRSRLQDPPPRLCCGLVGAFCNGELLDTGKVCEQDQGFCR